MQKEKINTIKTHNMDIKMKKILKKKNLKK